VRVRVRVRVSLRGCSTTQTLMLTLLLTRTRAFSLTLTLHVADNSGGVHPGISIISEIGSWRVDGAFPPDSAILFPTFTPSTSLYS
jgi:hypothetical protein